MGKGKGCLEEKYLLDTLENRLTYSQLDNAIIIGCLAGGKRPYAPLDRFCYPVVIPLRLRVKKTTSLRPYAKYQYNSPL